MEMETMDSYRSFSSPLSEGMEAQPHPVKRRKRSKYCDAVDKICDVCGDVAKSMHFGGMACDSCKAFFRRSVQSDSFKTFKCGAQKSCPVIKDNRRICQYCRFQKCLSVGMEVKWVMSEADRMNLWKSKISKQRHKQDSASSPPSQSAGASALMRSNSTSTKSSLTTYMFNPRAPSLRPEEQSAIDHLVNLQEIVFSAIPYPEDCQGDTPATMANLFFCICQKLRSFFFRLDDYHEIPKEDQPLVLRNGISMSIYLHGAYNYDVKNQKWPAPNIKEALKLPNVTIETLRMFTVFPDPFAALMDFYNEYGDDLKDEVVLVLLCLITLFHDTDCGYKARAFIQNVNNRYICLLRNYLQAKKGEQQGNDQLTRLLNSLFAVKKITNFHSVVDITHSVKTDQLISNRSNSLRDQMEAISLLLNTALISDIPKHSSALTPDEKVDLQLTRLNQTFTFRRPNALPDPKENSYFHHPLTNTLFGAGIRTDKLLSFAHKNIFSINANSRNSCDSFKSNIRSIPALSRSNRCPSDGNGNSFEVARYERPTDRDLQARDVGKLNQYAFAEEPMQTGINSSESTLVLHNDLHQCSKSMVNPYVFPYLSNEKTTTCSSRESLD